MFDFFQKIIDAIASLASFLAQTVAGLIRLLGIIPDAVHTLTSAIGFLPSILATFASLTITICVIFIIAGRNGGGQQ